MSNISSILLISLLLVIFVKHHQIVATATNDDVCLPENHRHLNEEWRYHDRMSRDVVMSDDTKLVAGWYRFSNSSFRMLQRNEMFPDLTTKDRFLFRPSGSQPFQTFRFFPFPPRLYTRITPLYVLQGQHPTINGELVKMKAVECYYESVLNIYGVSPLPKDSGVCDLRDPKRANCTFERFCEEDQSVEIKIRHCGSFYVYRLSQVRELQESKFFAVPKGGLYCGSKDSFVNVSAPCKCQLSEKNEGIFGKSKCNDEYKETLEKEEIERTVNCLKAELNVLVQEDQGGAACVNELWEAEHKKTGERPYPPQSIKEQQRNCYDFRRRIKDAISKKFDRLRPFLKH